MWLSPPDGSTAARSQSERASRGLMRATMKKCASNIIQLGELELAIMKVVWNRGTATVHDVQQAFLPKSKRAYSTVLSTMRKLETKGFLMRKVHDRAYVHRATITRQEVRESWLNDLLERVFDGSPPLLMSGLLDYKDLMAGELAAIRKVISKKGQKHERRRK